MADITLDQHEEIQQDAYKSYVVDIFRQESKVLRYLPFRMISAPAFVYDQESTLPSTGFRSVNEGYSSDVGTTSQTTEQLKRFGGKVPIDRFYELTSNRIDAKKMQVNMLAKSTALNFEKYFFKGDDSYSGSEEFNGLENRISADQTVDGGSDALTLAELDKLIDSVKGGPDVIFLHKSLIRKVNDLCRAEGQALEFIDGQFGRKIAMYAGYPLVDIGVDASDSEILSDEASSPMGDVYAVRFGSNYCLGIAANNMRVLDLGLVNGDPQDVFLIDWFVSYVLQHPESAARLQNVALPA
jgi:hypothetical protein